MTKCLACGAIAVGAIPNCGHSDPPSTIDSPQEGADLGASARSDEAKTALSRQVATSISGAYHDGYRDGYQTAKHEFEAQSIRKLENEKYQ
jgi:hypothetical protein